LNKSRLDYFYWILTAINVVNLLVYLLVARSYKGRGPRGIVRDEPVDDGLGEVKREDDKRELQSVMYVLELKPGFAYKTD
jgi:hypothetical protein